MYEVETKLRAAHEDLEETLQDRGANRIEAVTQIDVYYGAPHRDFATTDEALRRRTERRDGDDRTVLTYKGPRESGAGKVRPEHETVVRDPDALASILEALGFEPAATVTKRRHRYDLDGVAVTLDEVEELGEFVEVETGVKRSDIDAARDRVTATIAALGLSDATPIQESYLELLLEK
ncbi:MAG: class IV adenylate cyclase [Halodesulfurarchaeum sp.]